ncbi:MAG: hypothetical protein R6W83_04190 [Cryobacterium sp.]
MDRTLPAVIAGLVLLGILALMWRSWRVRSRRDSGLSAGYAAPETEQILLASAECYYVATTPRDQPLERLAIPGLGFRARADLEVTGAGLWLALQGERPVYLPGTAIDGIDAATMAIDRVVETDGLLRLGWRLQPTDTAGTGQSVDSYFRLIDPDDRVRLSAAIRTMSADASSAAGRDESEA